MHVETSRFGTIEVADDDVVTFPDGVPGFRGPHRMVLLGAGQLPGAIEGDGHHTLFWLHDLDDPDLAFLTIVPWSAYPDYDIEVPPSEVDGADPDDLCILAIITVRRENGGVRLTSNLLAPVVIDTARRVGRQVILQDATWPVHAPLAESKPSTTAEAS
jgi:flagellar assembly factor FliW